MKTTSKKLIVGLGNPGPEFEDTYHNVGFLAVDAILGAERVDGADEPSWKNHKRLFAYAESPAATFVKPLTFMNESGLAVAEALKKFRAPTESLTVIHDESDLVVGAYKISEGKNAAGHNGVQSVISHLGTNDFRRIRIGIRPTEEKRRKKASDFVLSKIKITDRKIFEALFDKLEKLITD